MNTIEARVIQKVATTAEWNTSDLILYKGELAFVSDARNFKVGTGTTKFSDTDWFFNLPTDVYSKAEIDNQFNNYAKVNSIYSKTEIDNKYKLRSNSKYLNANPGSIYMSNFVDTVAGGSYQITSGYGNGLANTGSYSSNLYIQSNDAFFNLSVAPFNRVVILTAGNTSYKGETTSSNGWSRNLAFTVNDVAISAPGFNNTSLRELKENIEDYSANALELINNLKIVKYDYKEDNAPKNMIGVIVDDESTADDFKDESGNAINIYKMISILTKAVQELSKK